jgi:hypothetical protein
MYRRPILCTFHIAVDFLIESLKKACMGGGGGGDEYVKLLYVLAENRIQKLMYRYIKLLMYGTCVFIWRLDL